MSKIKSGKAEGFPYSLSRWTDLPAAKWQWFESQVAQGYMMAFHPETGIPSKWSLDPKETLGLTIWTKDPTNLLVNQTWLRAYKLKIHITCTGWEEVEKGAPDAEEGADLIRQTVEAFGPDSVEWRFSPVPLLPTDLLTKRFQHIARTAAQAGLKRVYLAFLQANDLIPETRDQADRLEVLTQLAVQEQIEVILCNEDQTLHKVSYLPGNLKSGVCAPPEDWQLEGHNRPPAEGCGCVLMVDPFTINESCTFGCRYCYAADKSLSDKKRNTTRQGRQLPMAR